MPPEHLAWWILAPRGWLALQSMEVCSSGDSSTIFLLIINVLNISVVQQREPVSKLCQNADLLLSGWVWVSCCSVLGSALWCSGKVLFISPGHQNYVCDELHLLYGVW